MKYMTYYILVPAQLISSWLIKRSSGMIASSLVLCYGNYLKGFKMLDVVKKRECDKGNNAQDPKCS